MFGPCQRLVMCLCVPLATALAGCGKTLPGKPVAAPVAPTPSQVLAQIGNAQLTWAQLPPRVHQRMERIDDDHAQEQLVALWAGIEDAIGEQLLEAEAARRGLDVAGLLAREVTAKAGRTTEAEVRALYESHRAVIDAPYDEAAPTLREHARTDRLRGLRRALIDRLRADANVQVSLPAIGLHRTQVNAFGPRLGPANAPLTLILFSDFSCPYSAQARRLVEQLHGIYGAKLAIVHRNYPLRQHDSAKSLALAGICAAKQGKFWAYYERAFERASLVPASAHNARELVTSLATAAGLDLPSLNACLVSRAAKEALARDVEDARQANVRGTPSLFLNGMPLRGVLPLPVVQSLIANEELRLQHGRPQP